MTHDRRELAQLVKELRARGMLGREIADELGISRSYAFELIADPSGRDGARRKRNYRGVCQGCGHATTGCNGPGKAPRFCSTCAPDGHSAWPPEVVIAALQAFHAEHGVVPRSVDCTRANGLPTQPTIQRKFGSLGAAMTAAGLEPRGTGKRRRGTDWTRDRAIAELQALANDLDRLPPRWAIYNRALAQQAAYLFGGIHQAYRAAGVRTHQRRRTLA